MKNYIKIILQVLAVICGIKLLIIPFTFRLWLGALLFAILLLSFCLYVWFFDKFSKKIQIYIASVFAIPLFFGLFLGIYGNISTSSFSEDVVIVLGAGVEGYELSPHLVRRLDRAVYYFSKNPNAYILVSGGLGERAYITEAEAMARYLVYRGIPFQQIILEESSTSTYENLVFSQKILQNFFETPFDIVIISNDFHLFRASVISNQIGMSATRIGASQPFYLIGENYIREMLALFNFVLRG